MCHRERDALPVGFFEGKLFLPEAREPVEPRSAARLRLSPLGADETALLETVVGDLWKVNKSVIVARRKPLAGARAWVYKVRIRNRLHGSPGSNMKLKHVMIAAGLAAAAAQPVSAHHSFAAEFDANKPVTLKGTVTKLEWANPHIWVYLDVKDDQGALQHWQCEGGPPNTLTRNGWTKDSLKFGDQVIIDGLLAKDGSKTCNARLVKLPDGRSVFAGSSGGDAPPPPKR